MSSFTMFSDKTEKVILVILQIALLGLIIWSFPIKEIGIFLLLAVLLFFTGKSRKVNDPILGIDAVLSPRQFQEYVDKISNPSSIEYHKKYEQFVYSQIGYDKKMPLMFSNLRAHIYNRSKIISFPILTIIALLWPMPIKAIESPSIPIVIILGMALGFSAGLTYRNIECSN